MTYGSLEVTQKAADRMDAIDYFRGLSVILMVLVDYVGGIASVPGWLKHAPDIGLTVADLVAPAFIFAIGLTYGMSFGRRAAREGLGQTYYHFIARFLAIAGIGAIFTAGAALVAPGEARGAWSVLQAIGVAGLITLALVRTGTLARLLAGLGLLVAYQLVLDRFWLSQVLSSSHGGLQASLGWGAMLLISTALADLFHRAQRGRSVYAAASAALLAVGVLASLVFAVSKNRVSLSYVLISVAISALVFLAFDVFSRRFALRLPLLRWWGRNPLLLYVIHILLLVAQLLPGRDVVRRRAAVECLRSVRRRVRGHVPHRLETGQGRGVRQAVAAVRGRPHRVGVKQVVLSVHEVLG
jgi:predicted acyltransferase